MAQAASFPPRPLDAGPALLRVTTKSAAPPIAGLGTTGPLIATSTPNACLPSLNFQNSHTYDAASNRISRTAPDGSIMTYGQVAYSSPPLA
jgi:hypothetical protein